MRFILRYACLLFLVWLLTAYKANAQTSTNMGKEFYTAYAEHIYPAGPVGSNITNTSSMFLYVTSDRNASVKVEVMDGSFNQQFTVTANQVTTIQVIPSASLKGLSKVAAKKAVHITSTENVSVFAQIYGATTVGVSGATMLLPVNVLGTEYRSVNFTQTSNAAAFSEGKAYNFLNVVATEDNTTIEITPKANVYNDGLLTVRPAGTPFTITLNKGDVYQGLSDDDLTGSRVRSVGANSAICNQIAVFSGSSKTAIYGRVSNCTIFSTSDNLFQQAYPVTSWGTQFATVPLAGRETQKDIYRVIVSDPATTITGVPAFNAADLETKGYIEFVSDQPMVINADKPVQVAQYAISQFAASCSNTNGDTGDPEMIYLNPVEQGVTSSSFYAAGKWAVANSFLNVTIPTDAVASFKLDGVRPASVTFAPIPGNSSFSYAQIRVSNGPQVTQNPSATLGVHSISADKPFNATVYGFGNFESYGYSAGASFKKLNEALSLRDPATNATAQSTICSGKGYTPQLTLPFQVAQITWKFDDGTNYVQNNPTATSTRNYNQTVYTYSYFNSTQNTNLIHLTAGSHKIIATVANASVGCGTDDNELSVTVTDAPVPLFATTSACIGQAITFTPGTPTNNNNVASVLWNFGDNSTATTFNVNHIYTAAGSYNATLTINYTSGCSATSAVQIVRIIDKPVAAFNYSSPDCAATAISFKDNSTATGSAVSTWAWDFGDNTASTSQNPTHTYPSAGNYKVSLTVTNNNGCAGDVITQIIVVNPVPTIIINQPASVCVNASPITITANKNGATGTEIFTGDGITPEGLFDPAIAGIGTHAISYNFTSAQTACTFSQSFSVSVTPAPDAPAVKYNGTCADGTTTFNVTNAAGDASIYNWDFGDGNVVNGGATMNHQFAAPGDYKVLVSLVTNNCGNVSAPVAVHINKKPVANFTYVQTTCSGESVAFKDASNDPENAAITSWLWSFGDGTTSTQQNPLHSFAAPGTYSVTLRVANSNGCQSVTTTQAVIITPPPIISIAQPAPQCEGDATMKVLATVTGATGKGVFMGDGISKAGDFNAHNAGPGIHVMTYTFTTTAGCTYTRNFNIIVYPEPIITIGNDVTLLEGDSTFLQATANGDGLKYKWYPASGLSRDDVLNPVATPLNDTKYTLTVTSASGCTNFANISVRVLNSTKIVNAFSPNGDGINDLWNIALLSNYPQALVNIYTRNGEKVFSSVGYSVPWDGKYNGSDLPAGVYYYIVNLKNGKKPIAGNVTIVR
ncbi:PKD domain-containing protein [Mucilaginibacter ginkgonis]|uniref:PKD domain-containing protein n=1 Tax=Mucilaginibacter ginkgonis TaxID=2682091 RepID=A0A7T7FCI9_9SPHI|nr:gliding motility-associated C-terminal domain-containing protein [Mucilaginibacter ginkgonis]QQL50608.1 PKD domain-containing protein [Mucilaginibacter ginkgonis]